MTGRMPYATPEAKRVIPTPPMSASCVRWSVLQLRNSLEKCKSTDSLYRFSVTIKCMGSLHEKKNWTAAGVLFLALAGLVMWDGQNLPLSLEQIAAAEERCLESRGRLPPKTFTSEGCTFFPQSDWGSCCIAHDATYWCGGDDTQREKADGDFQSCMTTFSPTAAKIAKAGIFIGGSPWLPTSWRWGYGWYYPER